MVDRVQRECGSSIQISIFKSLKATSLQNGVIDKKIVDVSNQLLILETYEVFPVYVVWIFAHFINRWDLSYI